MIKRRLVLAPVLLGGAALAESKAPVQPGQLPASSLSARGAF